MFRLVHSKDDFSVADVVGPSVDCWNDVLENILKEMAVFVLMHRRLICFEGVRKTRNVRYGKCLKDICTHLPLEVFPSWAVRVLYRRLHGTGHGDRLLVGHPPPHPIPHKHVHLMCVVVLGVGGLNLNTRFVIL
jgi:hypothetical protein